MNKDNKKFIVETLFLKEVLKYNLTLKEFIVLMYFDNDYDLTFDVKKVSNATCLTENDTLESFNSLLNKRLIKVNSVKDDNGKLIDKISLENFYNNLKESINLENEEKKENSIFAKFQEVFGKSLSGMDFEIINAWISKGFSEDLILVALNEAIKNNAPSLRYVDKILFEWGKKGYKSVDDMKKYNMVDEISYIEEKRFETQVFDYNWLDDDD
ncbi:MAG: DnaD domain-containing protein [Bacilli bacterium]